jgi:hypothetical protein
MRKRRLRIVVHSRLPKTTWQEKALLALTPIVLAGLIFLGVCYDSGLYPAQRLRSLMAKHISARIFLALLLALFVEQLPLHAETEVLRIDPALTGPGIEMVHAPHLALYDPRAVPRHRLVLFLVGTRSKTTSNLEMDTILAQWGYHVISLDYENNVITVVCAHSSDPSAFTHYREEILSGASVSDEVEVDPANSILNRFRKLLAYLVRNDPSGGWEQFVHDGQPAWDRIIVAGHSQGSGHAAYIGQLFRVDRVLMFSGPQDYMDELHRPAPWLSRGSETPPSHFFAFLNLHDPFNVDHQIANCMALMHLTKPQPLMVSPGTSIVGTHQILINDLPTKMHHNSTLFPDFENVWKYMLTTPLDN